MIQNQIVMTNPKIYHQRLTVIWNYVYVNAWWVRMLNGISEEFGDFLISFMHASGHKEQFHWSNPSDSCWCTDVIYCIDTLTLLRHLQESFYSPQKAVT